jgi:hypothetical protein
LLKQYITVAPGFQIQLRGFAGDKPAKKVTITSEEEQPLEILETSSTPEDTFAYKLTTIEKGKSYSLEITTPSGLKESFRGQIRLTTNSPNKPLIDLAVIGIVQKQIKAAPQYLYFGIIDTSTKSSDPKRFTRTVQFSRAKGNTFTVEAVESNPDRINTEVIAGTNGENYSLVVTLITDNLQKGVLKEEVKVHTKYNSTAEIVTVFVEAKIL